MSPAARRKLIPLIVIGLAGGVIATLIFSRPPAPRSPGQDAPADVARVDDGDPAAPTSDQERAPLNDDPALPPDASDATGTEDNREEDTPAIAGTDPVDLTDLVAEGPDIGVTGGTDTPSAGLGSLDPAQDWARIEFSRAGAGIRDLTFADIWETAGAARQAQQHREDASRPPPDESLRYQLQQTNRLFNQFRPNGLDVPALAANQIEINGEKVNLFEYSTREGERVYVWTETAAGRFETIVRNGTGDPIVRVTRAFIVTGPYVVDLEQRVENLTSTPLEITWSQYGPGGLRSDRSRYMDRRRFRFGYLESGSPVVLSDDNDLLFEHTDVTKRWKKALEAIQEGDAAARSESLTLWPNKSSRDRDYELAWFGATNRYFGVCVYPPADDQPRVLAELVDRILIEVSVVPADAAAADAEAVFTHLVSPAKTVEAGGTIDFDLGVFAGPLDRHVLGDTTQPFAGLALQNLIIYQMSSFCAICTFQWLANLLLAFLSLLHNYVFFDWGLAIVGLVVVVRTILHPITKRSQISMQRFGKAMGEMKPEIDKLQKKFPNDPKRLQQEQMRMMRERGINPLQMLGCLPMFLQTPIWIALYAMLYFAYDIHQQPAFFGVFQAISNNAWPFLADLSSADHFFGELETPRRIFLWNVTGINVLPILMGLIFFVQQKYMSPPPSPTMSKEQIQQQKIMKIMMVTMFPLMLYSAPSGLTLYILTSSTIGIFESRYIRSHIKEMDLNPPKKEKKVAAATKPRDAQGRAYAAAIKRMQEKRDQKKKGPAKRYKKRK